MEYGQCLGVKGWPAQFATPSGDLLGGGAVGQGEGCFITLRDDFLTSRGRGDFYRFITEMYGL